MPLSAAIDRAARQATAPWGEPVRLLAPEAVARIAAEASVPPAQVEAAALDAGAIPERYLRNMRAYSAADQARLLRSRVGLVGLGGLGGRVLETLARTGVGAISAADGDRFEASNLNRQALAQMDTLDMSKACAAQRRTARINPSVALDAREAFLDEAGMAGLLAGCRVAVDALGGLAHRPALGRAASDAGIPLVTGALAGFTGYVAVVEPGQTGPSDFMGTDDSIETDRGCPAPAVETCAALMCAEIVKLLLGRESLAGSMLVFDLSTGTFETVRLAPISPS